MTRADLITAVASRFPALMAKDAEIAVKEILDAIGCSLAQGDRVEIRGFGSFSLIYQPARTGRNPRNGEAVPVPPKYVPHFKPWQGSARARRGVSRQHTPLQPAASDVAE
jgi:integration host factor subunit beta